MEIHPFTHHEIARLRAEERLLRAEQARRGRHAREAQTDRPPAATSRFRRFRLRRGAPALPAALVLVGILLASASIALAGAPRWAWTESKARQIVTRNATVQLPAPLKTSLAGELLEGMRLYGGLTFAAQEAGDPNAYVTFQGILARYGSARDQVRNGVPIDTAACKGSGAALRGNRFTGFRCAVTSAVLEIPSVRLDYGDRELPLVVEGPPRIEGPFQAQLAVRVVGRSAISYRQLGG